MDVNISRVIYTTISGIYLVLFLSPRCGSGSNVLISSMHGEGSHFFVGTGVGEGLVQRGHNATLLISRAFEHHTRNPKYSNLSFEVFDHHKRSVQEIRDFWKDFGALSLGRSNDGLIKTTFFLIESMADDCEDILLDVELMKRLEVVDAVVVDMTWLCGVMIRAALERNLNYSKRIALVTLMPFTPQGMALFSYGSPYNPAYQPELNTGFTNRMSFFQRTANLLQSVVYALLGGGVAMPAYVRVGKNTGLENVINYKMSLYHELADLHLQNFDFVMEFPFPIAPNVIPVGGGLTAWPAAELNEELEDFMESSGDHGVILFTFGTYFGEITIVQPGFAEEFAEAFRRLPQKVIWQMKDPIDELKVPSNVKVMPWVPQNDLLGHPKTRVFLYQGGNNGFQEACYHGVPIVVVPLHGDQFDVAARVEARGMGRKIDKMAASADVIYNALHDVISNPKYTEVAKTVSTIIKERPVQAREQAAFWIEHVIKYGGQYLKSSAMELSVIEYFMLDVMAFLLLIVAVIVFMVAFGVRLCWRMVCGKRKTKLD
ncbi:UDP-glucuronosyltransferase 2B13-like [Lytechinus variegatus]|uniref:UDP-glucuronosyltransferase 2B13-like n=1 Tax=Lytechinus variegatus TaxID=7654 RepID=UPI001BB22A46|nr:UDP-glucuronosyltransferase 2B13-like [Lytechinus variegatus]